jgi:FkbM family methyltransferase
MKFTYEVRQALRRHPALYKLTLSLYGILKITLVVFLKRHGYLVKFVRRKLVVVVISESNINFTKEIIDYFPYYSDTIKFDVKKRIQRLDFSGPRQHSVTRFVKFPFWFPTVPEPIVTIDQYLQILNLKKGETLIDLGSYSGLSAIAFKEAVGNSGIVVAIEADPKTFSLLEKNLVGYRNETNLSVECLHAAAYSSSGVKSFISEGTMASSLKETSVDGWIREQVMTDVPTVTLHDIVRYFKLKNVDAIKADIEGSEFDVFSLGSFFHEFRPRVLVEIPSMKESISNYKDRNLEFRERNLFDLFESYGYRFHQYHQFGSNLPLVLFFPLRF